MSVPGLLLAVFSIRIARVTKLLLAKLNCMGAFLEGCLAFFKLFGFLGEFLLHFFDFPSAIFKVLSQLAKFTGAFFGLVSLLGPFDPSALSSPDVGVESRESVVAWAVVAGARAGFLADLVVVVVRIGFLERIPKGGMRELRQKGCGCWVSWDQRVLPDNVTYGGMCHQTFP